MKMCTSIECPMKEECYRAVAENDDRQECFNYEYTCNELSGFCDFVSAKAQKGLKNGKTEELY